MSAQNSGPVSYELDGDVAVIRLDDGKANAISHAVVDELLAALATARAEAKAVVLVGRPGRFSAGFDLTTMRAGIGEARALVHAGAAVATELFTCPVPVVIGCTGHALAMGAILLMCGDVRIGAAGDFKLGLNEVAIGMPVPRFAVELAHYRLTPRQVGNAVQLATVYDPDGARQAGFLDVVVPADDVVETAISRAHELAGSLDPRAFRLTRDHVRGSVADRLTRALADDVTL